MMENKKNFDVKNLKLNLPKYTVGEEIFNAVSHGIGAILGIVALVLLIVIYPKNFKNIFCFSIYGSALIVLYTISAVYHALKISNAKKIFRKLDHCSIFLLIAGTYTPICALLIKGITGVALLASVWGAAILGIILNAIDVNKFSKFSLGCYILMGWAAIFAVKPLINNMSARQLFWLFSGGISYTLGAVIYVIGKKKKYMHSVWHLFVLAGSILHFMIFV